MNLELIANCGYVVAAFCFILGIKKLSSPATARSGNIISAVGMLIAIIVTLMEQTILGFQTVLIGLIIGSLCGVAAARLVAMTAMPEMVALLNGFGGGSSLLLAFGAFIEKNNLSQFAVLITIISILIGAVTFSGSIIAWLKLAGKIPGKPIFVRVSRVINSLLFLVLIAVTIAALLDIVSLKITMNLVVGISLVIGLLAVIAIGGGDMPVVIALLNSFSGIAASAAGVAVENILLIIAGLLVGASGLILTIIMCKSMNRTLKNVLFGAFGGGVISKGDKEQGEVNPISPEDAFLILEAAQSVVVVPGYGMAVAQAQHVVRELTELLEANGTDVSFAIHPVAGRMPGHMNVLLAEAHIPYDKLIEMETINPRLETIDVCLVIGANDVVNPDALEDVSSPIYGMPIIEVNKAKTVFVLKRSMNPGFAGIQNPLFFKENTRMLFGDAKASIQSIVSELNG